MPGYGKYRSPEEKEEFVKQLGADAKQRVIDLAENWEADAKDVAEFLIFSSRFPDYSVRNQMLIYKQNPYAMFTAGYNQFEKMGYTVQKGEKGMRIWVPHNITYYRGKESEPWKRLTKSTPKAVRDMIKAGMLETREELQFYRYGVVFDIAQTNCPAEDYPKLVGLGCADELHAAAFDIISEYSNRCGMPVRTIDLKSVALRGYYESETCNITIIIDYDLSKLGEGMNAVGMLIVLESIYSRLMDNWRKKRHTYIYIDEIMTIFRNPYAAQYFASLWQRIRKRGGYIIGATQNTTEILNSPEARKLLENSYIITMLYQSAPDRDVLAEMFSLSEAQKQALAKEQYGTGLIKVGSTIVPFENDFPTDNPLYQLMSTKPSDGWGQEVNEHYDV